MIDEIFAMRVCGFLFLFILVTNAASVAFGNEVGEVDSNAKLQKINDDPNKFQISVILAIISHASIIALAVLLFIVFSQYNPILGVVWVVFRIGESLLLIYNEINFWEFLNLAKDYAVAGNAEKIVLGDLGNVILQTKNSGFTLAMTLLAIGALAYAFLFITSGVVPSFIGYLGLAASVLSIVGSGLKLVVPGLGVVFTIGFMLMMLFEVIFGGWLLFSPHKIS